jgi:hypothetical protein
VVHVEVDHGDPLESVERQRMGGSDRDVVEEAEPHGPAPFGVMPRRADVAERVVGPTPDHEVRGQHRRARGAIRRLQGVRVHRGVGVHVRDALVRGHPIEGIQMGLRMHPEELFPGRQRGLVHIEGLHQTRGDELILDGTEPCRTLRVMVPHVVAEAVGVTDEGSGHGGGIHEVGRAGSLDVDGSARGAAQTGPAQWVARKPVAGSTARTTRR